jgi:hypothetical protein
VLARDPSARPRSARQLVEELDAAIREIDPKVSPRDVALLVNLHLATEPKAQATSTLDAALFAQELEAFVQAGHDGAAPLDPNLFGRS